MDPALRLRKEHFVSGHAGSSMWQVQQILLIPMFAFVVWARLCQDRRPLNPSWSSWIQYYLVDYSVLISPVYFVVMDSKYATPFICFVVIFIFVDGLVSYPLDRHEHARPSSKYQNYIAIYRAYMQMMTILCILAVDFPVFPRKHAKVETFGTSLMDIGVGTFIFSSGLVAGNRLQRSRYLSAARKIYSTIKISMPLFMLGIARALVTKSINYQEHVSEYGTHWNFFFTLMFIPLITTLLDTALPFDVPYHVLGIACALVYEYLLQSGLENYILNAPRVDLISMNKEGIFSCFGYLSIFLIACHIGKILLCNTHQSKLKFLLMTLCLFASMLSVTLLWTPLLISRRLANLGYVLWVITTNLISLLLLYVIEIYFNPLQQLPIWVSSVNRNQLAVFLLANVLTGAVNVSISTVDTCDRTAHVILITYTILLGFISIILDRVLNITLKF